MELVQRTIVIYLTAFLLASLITVIGLEQDYKLLLASIYLCHPKTQNLRHSASVHHKL